MVPLNGFVSEHTPVVHDMFQLMLSHRFANSQPVRPIAALHSVLSHSEHTHALHALAIALPPVLMHQLRPARPSLAALVAAAPGTDLNSVGVAALVDTHPCCRGCGVLRAVHMQRLRDVPPLGTPYVALYVCCWCNY